MSLKSLIAIPSRISGHRKQKPKRERFLTVGLDPEHFPHRRPSLRLRGHWLAEAGFQPAARVRVRVEKGRLVLTALTT